MIEYPSFRSAVVSIRLGNGVPANLTGGSDTAVPSSPVRVIDDSHSDGEVVVSPLLGYVCARDQESTSSREDPSRASVVIVLSS